MTDRPEYRLDPESDAELWRLRGYEQATYDFRTEIARLRGLLERAASELSKIADGLGVCGNCGSDATGPYGGVTSCCEGAFWQKRNPIPSARALAAAIEEELK